MQRDHQQAREAGDRRFHRRPLTTFGPERGDEKARLPPAAISRTSAATSRARGSPARLGRGVIVRRGDGDRFVAWRSRRAGSALAFDRRLRAGLAGAAASSAVSAGGASAGAGSVTATSASGRLLRARALRLGLGSSAASVSRDRRLFVDRALDHRRAVGLDRSLGSAASAAALPPAAPAPAPRRSPAPRLGASTLCRRVLRGCVGGCSARRAAQLRRPRRLRAAPRPRPPRRRRRRRRPWRSPSCSRLALRSSRARPRSSSSSSPSSEISTCLLRVFFVVFLFDRRRSFGRGGATGRGPELSTRHPRAFEALVDQRSRSRRRSAARSRRARRASC